MTNPKHPEQRDLFGDSREPVVSALVTVTPVQGPLSALQRTFNRLTERIRRSRQILEQWDAFMPRFQQRLMAELKPIEDALRIAQKRLVLQLHALLAPGQTSGQLKRKQRGKVRALLLDVADDLLQHEPDPEIEALYDRYSDLPHAQQRKFDMEMAEWIAEEVFGPDAIEGHEAQSAEELLRQAGERAAERDAHAHADSRRSFGYGKRHQAAEKRAEAAREAAASSVREIYRKLTSALHPDRETDPVERDRKTILMQRANGAYERNDLLELFTLQIEIEQIDASALGRMPAERLTHYNRVLQDQAHTLDAQIAERVAVFRIEFELTMREVTPRIVEQALGVRVVQARTTLEEIERATKRLADPQQRHAALNDLRHLANDPDELEELSALAEIFGDLDPPKRPAARKWKQKRRRR